MKKLSTINYLFFIIIITVISGIIYASVQQTYRTAANDPQIQIARDISDRLSQGKPIEKFFEDTINIEKSLSVFNELFDADGTPVRSSGYLDDKMPELPTGVFEFAKQNGEHDVTWQPRGGVRMAMVIITSKSAGNGFVASGRSLQEVELREHNLITMVFFGWIICTGLILLHALIQFYNSRKN